MSAAPKLRFGLPSIAPGWCTTCGEETLHQWCRCVHCGTRLASSPEIVPPADRKPELSLTTRHQIRRRALAGENTLHLLHEYGISYSTLQRAVRGHR